MSAYDGSIISQVDPKLLAPPLPAQCRWSDQQNFSDDLGSGWIIEADGTTFTWSNTGDVTETDVQKLLTRSPHPQDLQNVPQLALTFGSGSKEVRLEIKHHEQDDWHMIDVSHLTGGELTVPTVIGRSATMSEEFSSSLIAPLSMVPSSDLLSQSITLMDPCALFTPSDFNKAHEGAQASIAHINLTSSIALDDQTNRSLMWGGAHPHAGRVPLHSVRITPLNPEHRVHILALSYRSW